LTEDDILHRVTLLGILKKKPDESLEDVMEMLIDTGMYVVQKHRGSLMICVPPAIS